MTTTNLSKKAQMETMGLVVVVLLVTIAMFFILVFRANSADTNKQDFVVSTQDEEFSTKFLVTFLQTNTECHSNSIERLIYDCARRTGDTGDIDCSGTDSCTYLDKVINDTVVGALGLDDAVTQDDLNSYEDRDKWVKSFRITLHGGMIDPDDPYIYSSGDCDEEQPKGRPAYQPISLYPQPDEAVLTMEICYPYNRTY